MEAIRGGGLVDKPGALALCLTDSVPGPQPKFSRCIDLRLSLLLIDIKRVQAMVQASCVSMECETQLIFAVSSSI